jgi:polyhydroxyalkanoate synthesis regulator phasin
MVDKSNAGDPKTSELDGTPANTRRGPGHRAPDMRDTMAELAERAQVISQEAGTKVSLAMKDVISAAAGIAGFAIESARDLVQYMVKRGQMTQEEADKLIRQAEEAHGKRPQTERERPTATKVAADKATQAKAEAAARAEAAALHFRNNAPPLPVRPVPEVKAAPAKPAAAEKPPAEKAAAKKSAPKAVAAKSEHAKAVPKKAPAKASKPAAKAAKKAAAKKKK